VKTHRVVVVAMLAALLSGCGLDLLLADWKVDRLCKKDGGVKVYVREPAPPALLQADGKVDIRALMYPKPGQSHVLKYTSTDVQTGEPYIFRSEYRLFRSADNTLMGIAVTYNRRAQNLGIPFLARRPYSCPSTKQAIELVDQAFSVNSEGR